MLARTRPIGQHLNRLAGFRETAHLGATAIAGALVIGLAPEIARLLASLDRDAKLADSITSLTLALQNLRYLLLTDISCLGNTRVTLVGKCC